MEHLNKDFPITPEDCAVIFGADPHKSAFTLWAEKLGLVTPQNPSRERRPIREPETRLAQLFLQRTGLEPRRTPKSLTHPEKPWAVTEPHWELPQKKAGLTFLVEEKPSGKSGPEYPQRELYRCLHRMLVTGKKLWYLALYTREGELVVQEIPATDNMLKALALGEEQFRQRVLSRDNPVLDGSDSTVETLEAIFPEPVEKSRDLSQAEPYIRDYLRWKTLEDEAGAAARIRANTIKAFLGNRARGHVGEVQVLWPLVPTWELDIQALQKDHPELNLEPYRLYRRQFQVLGAFPES